MADVQRSVSTILALFADNPNGQISEQDARDALVSWRNGHGQIYVAEADTATITITTQSVAVEVTEPVWTESADLHFFDESGGNGRLTYIGIVPLVVHVANTVSFSSVGNNKHTDWYLALSGVKDEAATAHMKTGTGGDQISTAMHLVVTMSTGDYLSVWVSNNSDSTDLTLISANLQAMTMPT